MKDSSISFWLVPHEIATLDLGLTEKSILAVVFSFTRNGGECWATDKQFAVAFGMGERTIERAISRLYLLGYLERHVERKAGGITPRRLSLTLPYRQIDATPQDGLSPYRQIDATLAPNCPPPTVKMTLGYRQNDAQIVSNINKDEVTISSPLPCTLADSATPPNPLRGTQKIEIPISESETKFEDSVVKDSLTSQESPSLEKPSKESLPPSPVPPAPPSKKLRAHSVIELADLGLEGEMLRAAEEWLAYKRERKEKFTLASLKSLIAKMGPDFPLAVSESIARGWQGCFLPKDATTSKKARLHQLFEELHRTAGDMRTFIPVLKDNFDLIRSFGGKNEWEAFRVQLADAVPNTPSWYSHRKYFLEKLETHNAPR